MIQWVREKSRLVVVLLAAVVLAGAALAALRTEPTIGVETALQVALDNGFDAVIWEPTADMQRDAKELAETTGQTIVGVSGEGQIVIPRGRLITDVEQPLLVIWYLSADRAESRVEADRPLFEGNLTADERVALPSDFDVSRLREASACNLVVTSYDDGSDAFLQARVQAVVEDLRDRC